jgi:hypothetical protein
LLAGLIRVNVPLELIGFGSGKNMNDATALAVPDAPQTPTSLISFVAQAVSNPDIGPEKLEILLRTQREIVADEAQTEFTVALNAVADEMPRVKKNGTIAMGNKGSIPFATYEDMDTALRPLMTKYGFTISFTVEHRDGGGGNIVGHLEHTNRHFRTASMPLPLDSGPGRNPLQAMGSTLSYGKRYVVEMLFNIIREGVDDDGKRGGTKFVTDEQAAELRRLVKEAGRQEGPILDRLFSGSVRSFEELEAGSAFLATKSTLTAIIQQKARKDA